MAISLHPHVFQLFLICSLTFQKSAVLFAMPLDRLMALCPPWSCMTMPTGMRAAKIGLTHPQRSRVLIIPWSSISSGCPVTGEHLVPSPLPPSHGDLAALQRDGVQQHLCPGPLFLHHGFRSPLHFVVLHRGPHDTSQHCLQGRGPEGCAVSVFFVPQLG